MGEKYIKCPICELNYCTKKEKICASCREKLNARSGKILSSDKVSELRLCPICKVNYISDDEVVCSSCREETDLSDDELWEMYGNKHYDNDEEDEEDRGDDAVDDDDDLNSIDDDDLELLKVADIGEDSLDIEDEELDIPVDEFDDDEEDVDEENEFATKKVVSK